MAHTWSVMQLALGVVSLTGPREAERLVIVAGGPVLEVQVCWAVGGFPRAVLQYVALVSLPSAGGAVLGELAAGLAAGASVALGPIGQLAGRGIAAGVGAGLWQQ